MRMKTRISVEEAVDIIRANTAPLPPERRSGDACRGLVLAEDVIAPMSQPPFDRSPLDGYALIAADTDGASEETPARLQVIDTVYAGGWSEVTVRPGQCVRIMTGAPIPAGADCVVRQEDTDRGAPEVAVRVGLRDHENYCFRGEDYREGDTLIPAGYPLDAAALGLLAGAGLEGAEMPVRPRPRILLAGTGDELAPPGQPLRPGQIYNSNLPQLAARCRELGYAAAAVQLPDDPQVVARGLAVGVRDYDCVITTGGVSVGEKDIFHQALPLAGAERLFWRVMLKPGTPMMFSLLGGKPVLSLSGNPFAAAATFELFARPMLAALSGDCRWEPTTLSAPLADGFGKKSGGRRFVRGRYTGGAVHLPEGHSSGQLRSSLGCNCLVDIPAGSPALKAGDTVRVILL